MGHAVGTISCGFAQHKKPSRLSFIRTCRPAAPLRGNSVSYLRNTATISGGRTIARVPFQPFARSARVKVNNRRYTINAKLANNFMPLSNGRFLQDVCTSLFAESRAFRMNYVYRIVIAVAFIIHRTRKASSSINPQPRQGLSQDLLLIGSS